MTDQKLESKLKSSERKIPYDPSALSLDDEEKGQTPLKVEISKLDSLDEEKVRSKRAELEAKGKYPLKDFEEGFIDLVTDPSPEKSFSKELFSAMVGSSSMPDGVDLGELLFRKYKKKHIAGTPEYSEYEGQLNLHKLFTMPDHDDAVVLELLQKLLSEEVWLRVLLAPVKAYPYDYSGSNSFLLLAEQSDPSARIRLLSRSVKPEDLERLLTTLNDGGRTALHEYFLNKNIKAIKTLYETVSEETWRHLVTTRTHASLDSSTSQRQLEEKGDIPLHLLPYPESDPESDLESDLESDSDSGPEIIKFLAGSMGPEDWKNLIFTPDGEGKTPPQRYAGDGNIKALKALRCTVSDATWEKLVNYGGASGKSPLYLALERAGSLQPSESKTAFAVIKFLRPYTDRYAKSSPTSLSAMQLFRTIEAELHAMSVTHPRAALAARQLCNSLLTNVELALNDILASRPLADLMAGNRMAPDDCFYIEGESKQSGSTPINLRDFASTALQTLITFCPITKRGEFGEGRFFGAVHEEKLTIFKESSILAENLVLDLDWDEIPRSEITLKLTPEESKAICEVINLIQGINYQITKRITPDSALNCDFDKVVYHHRPQQTVAFTATRVASDDEKPIKGDSKIPTTTHAAFFSQSSTLPQSEISATASNGALSTTPNTTSKKKRKRVENSSAPSVTQ